jgi:NodT family efflux transporter outer membrane factor (OMF) lipoprotein
MSKRAPLVLMSALMASGCVVGPNYSRPEVPVPNGWTGLDADVGDSATASKPSSAAPELSRWWRSFGDPTLTSLVERAAIGNLDLVAAEARIRQARARRAIVFGGLLPTVGAFGTAAHAPVFADADGSFSANGNLFAAGFDASWELDLFGRVQRELEATDAGITSAYADYRDVWVTLAGEVAATYTRLRAAQSQLIIANTNLATQSDTRELTRKLHESGMVGALDVANATAQVEATTSRIPALEAQVREAIYTLGLLIGREPGALLAELADAGPIPIAPPAVPVGMPSELLQRRPDIRRAEAELHASTARVGIAVAEQFPRVTLSAALGVQNSHFDNFVSLATRYWSVGVGVTQPIFEGGRIQANVELQRAATDEALALYKQRVLVAFRDVETSLVNFSKEQQRRDSLKRTMDANQDAVDLSTELYTVGRTDFLNVLIAQRALLESQDALIRSDQAVADQLIALYKALGGGWELTEGLDAGGGTITAHPAIESAH